MKRTSTERLISLLSPLLLLVVWEIFARMAWIDVRFFPAPTKVLVTLGKLAATGLLWNDMFASLYRIGVGFVLAAIPAMILGMIMGLSRWFRAAVEPIIAALYPIPKSAILPLILLIFGLGEASKIAMVFIGVFFLVLINTQSGVMQIRSIYFDVGKSFGASNIRQLMTIALPGALPLIFTGLKLGMGMGLILVVLAEMVGARSGLGYMIMNAWNVFAVETMYAGLLVVSLLGFVFSLIIDELERLLVPWRTR
jgi:ABC-type nitrate/sulfonate/bicarbonate transport system permease component